MSIKGIECLCQQRIPPQGTVISKLSNKGIHIHHALAHITEHIQLPVLLGHHAFSAHVVSLCEPYSHKFLSAPSNLFFPGHIFLSFFFFNHDVGCLLKPYSFIYQLESDKSPHNRL